nr:unnamed protein product [Callosobruchus analis]
MKKPRKYILLALRALKIYMLCVYLNLNVPAAISWQRNIGVLPAQYVKKVFFHQCVELTTSEIRTIKQKKNCHDHALNARPCHPVASIN